MSRYLSSRLQSLAPYIPGEQPKDMQTLIKLNTNESPYPPAPSVMEVINDHEVEKLRLYPDPEAGELKAELARRYGIQKGQIICGNGSDEVLAFAFLAYGEQGVQFADITYGFYKVWAGLYGLSATICPLDDNFGVVPQDYHDVGKLVVIANPNAPTGMTIDQKAIEGILKSNPDNVVIIDEAYVDFGGESSVPLIEKYDNLLVVQTFSKSRNLAGARLGFGFGCTELIADLERVRNSFNPYNLNRLSILAGAACLREEGYFADCVGKIVSDREYTADTLQKLGCRVLQSSANFLFVSPPNMGGADYYKALREKGVLVRHFDSPRIGDFVRVSIGSRAEMEKFLTATNDTIGGKNL